MVRILLCGDLQNGLGALCSHVAKLHAKLDPSQHFQAVFCVGEFSSAGEMDLQPQPPIPVYFIDAGPAATKLIETSPQGKEVAQNVHFLGHFGVTTVVGLKVAFLSGRQHPDLFTQEAEAGGDAGAEYQEATAAVVPGGAASSASAKPSGPRLSVAELAQRYGAQEHGEGAAPLRPGAPADGAAAAAAAPAAAPAQGPSWEELKAKAERAAFLSQQVFMDGCYTPLAVERLKAEVAGAGGVDLLLTSEWPAGALRGLGAAWPEEMEIRRLVKAAAKRCSSTAVAQVAAATEPKYHAVGLGGVFWRRAPWRHEHRGEVVPSTGELRCGVCRMICLGPRLAERPAQPGPAPGPAPGPSPGAGPGPAGEAAAKPQKWLHGLDLDPAALPASADDATPSPWSGRAPGQATGSGAGGEGGAEGKQEALRMDLSGMDAQERRQWMQRFGCTPKEMQKLSDKLAKEEQPKERKEKHKSLYKVSEKEKKRRKTGGDGHLPFSARERMQASRG